MGNWCLKRKDKFLFNELIAKKKVKNVDIVIMKGNICNQKIDSIVNWVDCFLMKESTYIFNQAMNDKLKQELKEIKQKKGILCLNDCFSTGAGQLQNSNTIIHSTLPLWKGGQYKELQCFEEAIAQCIQQAINLNLKSIGFTLDTNDIFGFSFEDCSEVLFQSLYRFAQNRESTIEKIYFIHQNQSVIQLFKNSFLKVFNEQTDEKYSINSDKLKDFYFCQSTDNGDEYRKISGYMDDFDDLEANYSSNNLMAK